MSKTQSTLNILVVIVLYKLNPKDSPAVQTLQLAIDNIKIHTTTSIQIVLYDNAPDTLPSHNFSENVTYHVAPQNNGIAGAYNYAFHIAKKKSFKWVMTLDQDTRLPSDYMEKVAPILESLDGKTEIGAIVPHLLQKGKLLSPVRIRPWGVNYLPLESTGLIDGEIHAFNSGSLFRVDALQQIGGFDTRFWLDYQDASTYRKLHQFGKRVYVVENLNVEHDLSLISEQTELNPDRFCNFLLAESAYYDLYRSQIDGFFFTLRLAGRIWRYRNRNAAPMVQRLTRKAFLRRILHSRKRRVEDWSNKMHIHAAYADTQNDDNRGNRPKISVCMAAYNGERYITAQLQSILSQLAPQDEVIVVDDDSKDTTREKILALNDSRIQFIQHDHNCGVSQTFEDAIRAASGGILFLSDQDDIWAPNKVSVILEAFRSHPEATLIATDNALIDASGTLLSKSYFAGRGRFHPGLWANLIRNRFGGCTMAFRAYIVEEILPLPHKYDVLHDIWIGVRNTLAGYKSLYIAEPLVFNRRHSSTATGQGRLTVARKIRIRIHLLLALAEFKLRKIMFY